ncbi:hypothetical protein CF319_g4464 [Tilletia indica]|nr:hypothetical protein CF319_g4464 [Tilletia indica]
MSLHSLPPEVLAIVVSHFLRDISPSLTPDSSIETLRRASLLRRVSRPVRKAVEQLLCTAFHAFQPPHQPIVRGLLSPWMPSQDSRPGEFVAYWTHHFGTKNHGTLDLQKQARDFDMMRQRCPRSVRIDARVPGLAASSNYFNWSVFHFPQWFAAAMLLSRLFPRNPNLKFLHLRVSAQEDIFAAIHTILAHNCNLTDVVIEADSPLDLEGFKVPMFNLSETTLQHLPYARMERFLLRAPSACLNVAQSAAFVHRISNCTTMCFAVQSIEGHSSSYPWAFSVLAATALVERAEVSVSGPRAPSTVGGFLPPIHLLRLAHLTLDMVHLNAYMLTHVHAPLLRHLCIRTDVPLAHSGDCPPNHFPSLRSVTLSCPGPVISRFASLGLGRSQYISGLDPKIVTSDCCEGTVLCLIKKDSSLPNAYLDTRISSALTTKRRRSIEDDGSSES